MLNVRLAGDHQYGKLLFTWLFYGVCFVLSVSHEMSWVRSGTDMSQFLRVILPTLVCFLFSWWEGGGRRNQPIKQRA